MTKSLMPESLEDFHKRLEQLDREEEVFQAEKYAFWRAWVPVFGAVWYIVQLRDGFYKHHPFILKAGTIWSNITSVYLPFTVFQIWSG